MIVTQLRLYGGFVRFAVGELDLAWNCLFTTNFIDEALTLPCSRTRLAGFRVRSIPDRYYPNGLTTVIFVMVDLSMIDAPLGRPLFFLALYDWTSEADKGRT
jgi:hypothetical protein